MKPDYPLNVIQNKGNRGYAVSRNSKLCIMTYKGGQDYKHVKKPR